MLNELAIFGMHVASPEVLGDAIERAISGLAIGIAIALLLGALVLGVESLSCGRREKKLRKQLMARNRAEACR